MGAAVLLGGCASAPAGESACAAPEAFQEIALERGDGMSPVIRATVNEAGPFAFVLDNGASGTTLDPATTERLGLPRDAATETAQGLGGPTDVRLYRARSIRAGGLEVKDAIVPAVPAPDFDSHDIVGLAGVDLMGARTILWDLGAMRIAHGAAPPTAPACWTPVASDWVRPWKILVDVEIGGVAGKAMIDTGLQKTTMNRVFARALGLDKTMTRSDGVSGLDGRSIDTFRAVAPRATMGPWTFENASIEIADLDLFNRLDDAAAPRMVLGADWLAGKRFAIDYAGQRVWLIADER